MVTQQQTSFKVLLIGDNCEDIYQFGTIDRLSPEAPVPVLQLTRQKKKPGMAGNVKENLEKLGCTVDFIYDRTSIKTRYIDERSGQHIVRVDLDKISEKQFVKVPFDNLNQYEAIVISDYNKGTVDYDLICNLRIAYNGPIFIDTKKTDLQKIPDCYIKINKLEYDKLQSYPFEDYLIVTLGGEGAMHKEKFYSAPEVEVVDVTGAGDTFLAALTYKFLCTNDISKSIEFAIRASSITVQKLGVYAPTLGEINAT